MTVSAALTTENVGRRYRRGKPWAVRELSLDIPAGSITALVGPNGAGKSTLIRCFVGFERPDTGLVRVQGIDPAKDRRQALGLIAYVPQASALYRSWTADDHFAFAAIYRQGFDRVRAQARLRSLGIDVSRPVSELSGGEQAQVSLALATAVRAPVLLLDEPLAHLDPLARREFLATLTDDVRSTGATVMLSSHIITDVQQACDRLVVLAGGELRLSAPIEQVLSTFRTVPVTDLLPVTPIGVFMGPDGRRLALVPEANASLPFATLEEVVLGHLAAARLPAS